MANCGIYTIKNKLDGKMYIGQSVNINKRKAYHLWMLRSGNHFNPKLQNAFNKYSEENFEFKVLELCKFDEINNKEIQFIKKYNSIEEGYNICEGGNGSLGRILSDETKRKIAKANIGRIQSKEAGVRKSVVGKILWSNIKYREKMMGRKHPIPWNKGIPKTLEEKQNLSEKLKGRVIAESQKEKLRELYKGENSITAKLKEKDVIEIRLRFLKGEEQCCMKKDYLVSSQTIYDIVRNRRWKHLPNTIEELEKIREAK